MLTLRFVRLEGRDKSTGSSVTPVITVDETLKLPEGRVGRSHRGLLHNQYLTFTVCLSITASPLLIVSLQNRLLIGYSLCIWFQTKSRITFTSNCHLQKMTWEKGQTFCVKHYIYLTPTLRTSALREMWCNKKKFTVLLECRGSEVWGGWKGKGSNQVHQNSLSIFCGKKKCPSPFEKSCCRIIINNSTVNHDYYNLRTSIHTQFKAAVIQLVGAE